VEAVQHFNVKLFPFCEASLKECPFNIYNCQCPGMIQQYNMSMIRTVMGLVTGAAIESDA
jgi:hypothetical protein